MYGKAVVSHVVTGQVTSSLLCQRMQKYERFFENMHYWRIFYLNYFQIEQDMVIERALVEMFSDDFLKKSLAFRREI
jgi:transcriptional regulator of NAD metabolism